MATKNIKRIHQASTSLQSQEKPSGLSMAAEAHNPMHGPTMSCQEPHKPGQYFEYRRGTLRWPTSEMFVG